MIYDLPGGLEGVQSMVAAFQARGVRVLWACFPWDHGSRNTGRPGERNGLRSTDRNISLNSQKKRPAHNVFRRRVRRPRRGGVGNRSRRHQR
jgi:hypothetical protein